MKIILDISPNLIRKIQGLIGKKLYNSITEFVKVAVENQLALEFPLDGTLDLEPKMNIVNNVGVSVLEELKLETERSIITEIASPEFRDIKLPWVNNEQQMWLWGQINKVFPIKFVIRYLSNLLKNDKETIVLEEFYKKVSGFGRNMGNFLLQEDNKNNRRRDERFSTAFPIGEEKSKSFSRFCSQFIGYKRTDGILSGALFVLKFANLKVDNGQLRIGITKSGLQFAKIKNPLFDEGNTDKNLSEEEVNFYLDHIIRRVPGEAKAFFLLLDLVNKGAKSREMLNEKIKEMILVKWSDDIINTQRTGVLSRLYELGLISKKREGIFVEYSITQKGQEYIDKYIKSTN